MLSLLNKIAMMLVDLPEGFEWVENILGAIDLVLWPILIVVAAAGTIYSVVIGVTMARADSTEKREEAKKRLVNVIIGIVVVIALILFFRLLPEILVALLGEPEAPAAIFRLK